MLEWVLGFCVRVGVRVWVRIGRRRRGRWEEEERRWEEEEEREMGGAPSSVPGPVSPGG